MELKQYVEKIYAIEKELVNLSKQYDSSLAKQTQIELWLNGNSRNKTPHSTQRAYTQLRNIEKGLSTLMNRIAERNREVGLLRLEYEKINSLIARDQVDALTKQKKLNQEIEQHKRVRAELDVLQVKDSEPRYDFFICHSSEDKIDLVHPLALELKCLGARIWYDEFELKIGDSLRQSIDKGLKQSRYGIVVFSKSFFSRPWANYELSGFLSKEMNGLKVILPIWHRVTKDEVQDFSPSLADKFSLNSSVNSISEIAKKLMELL